ncbi:transposase [Rubritalea spongiae]|uniref:Transposase n=1 Tax=Rubritalea spongiae TaxID=430797 RepID=A0ABW5E1X7_9BACT
MKRRKFSAHLKSKVAIEVLRGQLTIHEIAKKCQVHTTQVTDWKKALIGGA